MARILIGTSGWSYASWKGPFFPAKLLARHQLQYYASQFETAELNGVFYRTPTETAVHGWAERTGKDFVFAWKASKFITHWKRLGPTSVNSLALLESRLALLGHKVGPILFQLPPQFEANEDRLRDFLKLLNVRRRYAFEFRHDSWYTPRITRVLAANNVSRCLSDHHDAPSPWTRTADFVYIRGHGPSGEYKRHYSDATLREWADRAERWRRRGFDVYVYFDNDQKSAAPADALKLRRMLKASRPAAASRARSGDGTA